MSVRELFGCGSYLNSLEDSKLSNHIGYNGFVESVDGYVVFIKIVLREVRKFKKEALLEGGSKLLWVSKKELQKMCILFDMMIHEG